MKEEQISQIIEKVKELLTPILEEGNFELIDIEFAREPIGWVLRIYTDRQTGGITISDCQWISERIGTVLDVEDIIHHPYNLEVSSPGLDRPLKTAKDFEKYIGKITKIKTVEPIDSQRNFKGEIVSATENSVMIHDVSKNTKVAIPFEKIKTAKLDIDCLFNK